jgi:hypothetical protein
LYLYDFFELGGDSLVAIETTEAIEDEFGYELYIEDFLTVPGMADLSVLVWNGLPAQFTTLRHRQEEGPAR